MPKPRSGNPAKAKQADPSKGTEYPVLWLSNSPATGNTGYSTQTAQVVPRIRDAGHPIAVGANYGLEGQTTMWRGIPIMPRGMDAYSNDTAMAYHHWWSAQCKADALVITLFDVWVYGQWTDRLSKVASWVPIDHAPTPPRVLDFCRRPNVTPIAMSKFGADQLHRADVDCLYVPHALESVWKPTESVGNLTGRQIMGNIPDDAYVVTMNQANKAGGGVHRKAWAENLMAASLLMKAHDDVWLYIHSEDRGTMAGWDLHPLIDALGIPRDRLRIVDQFAYRMGMPQQALAAIYTATDIFLACSMGEGFGLTPLECQATGTPVVVSDWTAQPELVGDGWVVGGQPFWDAAQQSWWMTPNIGEIHDALEQAYTRGRERSDKAIAFAAQYDADVVFDTYWKPALQTLKP